MKKRDNVYAYMFGGNIYVNLTNRCCNNCTFCLRNTGDGVSGNVLWLEREPTASEAKAAVEKLLGENPSVKEVVFCGYGEPTYKLGEMLEVAKAAHAKGLKTRLNTNGLGSLVNGRDITPELRGAIDVVSVSLNESSAEKYDNVCKSIYGEKAFDELKDFAARCAALGIDTVMSVVDVIGEEAVRECEAIANKCGARLRVRRYEPKW